MRSLKTLHLKTETEAITFKYCSTLLLIEGVGKKTAIQTEEFITCEFLPPA
jgi:hypothetical protein